MLVKPPYIAGAAITDPAIRYRWHDWDAFRYCEPIDEEFVKRYAKVTPAAVIALTIAEAEWLMFRFESLSPGPTQLLYLESAWCANVDREYSWPIELPKAEWQGPIRRPMLVGTILVNHLLYEAEDIADTLQHPSLMSNLVEHVLPDRAPFRQWRDRCVERLVQSYTETPQDPFDDLFDEHPPGRVFVPREVFDPDFEFRREMARPLVDRFLRNVDWSANRFLSPPEEMYRAGFKGTPYAA
jgi:hypothetical protein